MTIVMARHGGELLLRPLPQAGAVPLVLQVVNKLWLVVGDEGHDIRPKLIQDSRLRHRSESSQSILHGSRDRLVAIRNVSVRDRSLNELAEDERAIDHIAAIVAAANEDAAGGICETLRDF